jgi:hypothetical protein
VYVKPSQIFLHPNGNLFYLPNRSRFGLSCGPIRKEVCDYKLDSCQLICMKRLLMKDTERRQMTENCCEWHEWHSEQRKIGECQQWMDEWQHWMATNGGRRRGDEDKRMKIVRSTGGTHGRWILGMLEVVARVWRLQISTVRCRHG